MRNILLAVSLLLSTACATTQPINEDRVEAKINISWKRVPEATHYYVRFTVQSVNGNNLESEFSEPVYIMVDSNGESFGQIEK